jgi:polysaccharide pyruvyl transferase WcaK-like protein
MPGPHVVLLGDVGGPAYHVGDEAMLDANVEILRDAIPGVRTTTLGRDARGEEIDAALSAADAAIVSGGGNLSSTWPELLRQRVAFAAACRERSVPLIVTGQTVGPNLSDEDAAGIDRVLASSDWFGARERDTLDLLLQRFPGCASVGYQVDDTFGLRDRRPADETLSALEPGGYVALSLDSSYGSDEGRGDVNAIVAQVAQVARSVQKPVVFVPHLGHLGGTTGADADLGRRVCTLLELAGAQALLAPVLVGAEAAWIGRRAYLVVSARYHPLVFATSAAVPAIGIHRDEYMRVKLHGALAHVGAGDWVLSAEDAARGQLLPMVRSLIANWAAIVQRGQENAAAVREHEQVRRAAIAAWVVDGDPAAFDVLRERPRPPLVATPDEWVERDVGGEVPPLEPGRGLDVPLPVRLDPARAVRGAEALGEGWTAPDRDDWPSALTKLVRQVATAGDVVPPHRPAVLAGARLLEPGEQLEVPLVACGLPAARVVIVGTGDVEVIGEGARTAVPAAHVLVLPPGTWSVRGGRALVLAFASAEARDVEWGGVGPVVAGVPSLDRPLVERRRRREIGELRETFDHAERYARSLEAAQAEQHAEILRLQAEVRRIADEHERLRRTSRWSIVVRARGLFDSLRSKRRAGR